MYTIRANSNRVAYGVKRYTLDTIEDLKRLNISSAYPGSTAFIIQTSTRYMLNNKRQWIKVASSTGGGSGGGNEDEDYDGGSIDGTDPDNPGGSDTDNDGYYDGGSIDGSDPGMNDYDGGSIDGTDPN